MEANGNIAWQDKEHDEAGGSKPLENAISL